MQPLSLTLVQTATAWHDPQANRDHFTRRLEALQAPGDIIVLPEMFATGFTMASAEQAETMDGPTLAWMRGMADRLGSALCGSLVIVEEGHHYNRLLFVAPGAEPICYDKRHLFRMAGEHEHYSPGHRRVVLHWRGWRICPQVCYDLRFPAFSRARDDYDVLLYVANWPAARAAQWRALLQARAIENQAWVAAVNVIGTDGAGVSYSGDSGVWDYAGERVADLGEADTDVTVALDAQAQRDWRGRFPAWRDADRYRIDGIDYDDIEPAHRKGDDS